MSAKFQIEAGFCLELKAFYASKDQKTQQALLKPLYQPFKLAFTNRASL